MCISVSLVAVDGKGEEFFCFLASRVFFLYASWDHVWVVVITHLYLSVHTLRRVSLFLCKQVVHLVAGVGACEMGYHYLHWMLQFIGGS